MADNKTKAEIEGKPHEVKNITLGQVFDSIEYIKKLWPILAGIVLLIGVSIKYFAPYSELEKVRCEAENRVFEMKSNSGLAILEREQTEYLRQQKSLRELQTIMLKIQMKNPGSKLDLSVLESEIDKLVMQAENKESEIKKEIQSARDDVTQAQDKVNSCGKKLI